MYIVDLVAHAFMNVWLIDIGKFFHMTTNSVWLVEYEIFDHRM